MKHLSHQLDTIKRINTIYNTLNITNSNRSTITFGNNFETLSQTLHFFAKYSTPTSREISSLHNFRIKILTRTLPTKQNLKIKLPHIYKNDTCPRCFNT